jgi:hypothetical protein
MSGRRRAPNRMAAKFSRGRNENSDGDPANLLARVHKCGNIMFMSKPTSHIKRRKPAAIRKEEWIRFRVSAEQKRRLEQGAEREGLALSAWLRLLGLRAINGK